MVTKVYAADTIDMTQEQIYTVIVITWVVISITLAIFWKDRWERL